MKNLLPQLLFTLSGILFGCVSSGAYPSDSVMEKDQMSFETTGGKEANWMQVKGWEGNSGGIRNNGYYSPPHGQAYACQKGGGNWITLETDYLIQAGTKYTLKLWARSVNQPGIPDQTILRAGFLHGDREIVTRKENLNPPRLKGAAATEPNDDGANVWIDGEYRHQFNEVHMYQSLSSDPIQDPWLVVNGSGYNRISRDLGWAVGNIIAGNKKFIYGTRYQDWPPWYSSLTLTRVISEKLPDYQWSDPELVLEHAGSEFPWVLDAHGYFDESTGRLWMAWGGGICYVSQMDPETGLLMGDPESKEFDDHPPGMHVAVATWPETESGWSGDQWSSAWNEGPSLYKHGGYWYFFASYGHLGEDYTIRVGRGHAPTGPFYDKHGLDLMKFDAERNTFGNSLLLGAEGEQLVPGHPHIWEEQGKFYMGYDFRKNPGEEMDFMGIRRLYWLDGWPSIWIPVELSFQADDHPELIGKKLSIAFRNEGEERSELGVDLISVTKEKTE